MAPENPLLLVGLCLLVLWLGRLWVEDWRLACAGRPNPKPFPGATPVAWPVVAVAVLGAFILLAVETWGEVALGVAGEQSTVTWLFGLYTLAAAFGEELVFRGYLVVTRRGRVALWASIVGFSLVFALLHPFLWTWSEDGLALHLDRKGFFSSGVVFAGSLWFYAVRFLGSNPERSLIPSIAAHLAKNLGVLVIKFQQGFVDGWW
ncbi:MAG: CPBP family intramembrane glutamic endopeptidase [Opitutaceae bacterium]